jgi:hypothetical protein
VPLSAVILGLWRRGRNHSFAAVELWQAGRHGNTQRMMK